MTVGQVIARIAVGRSVASSPCSRRPSHPTSSASRASSSGSTSFVDAAAHSAASRVSIGITPASSPATTGAASPVPALGTPDDGIDALGAVLLPHPTPARIASAKTAPFISP